MEGIGGLGFGDISGSMRKKRSNTSRRPWNESQPHSDFHDVSSFSSTPHSYNVCKTSCNDNNDYNSVFQKKEEASLKQCSSRASFNIGEAESSQNMVKAGDGGFVESDEASNNSSFRGSNGQRHSGADSRRPGEGVLAPANWRGSKYLNNLGDVSDVLVNENKVKKVKLKVGGVTRTINTKSASDAASAIGSCSTKSSHFPDASRLRPMMIQDNSDDHLSFPSDKGGVPFKEFTRSDVGTGKGDCLRGKVVDENMSIEKTDTYEPLRKSKRIPKRRFLDEQLDDDDDDDEIQYLENAKTAKVTVSHGLQYDDDDDDEEGGGRRKHRRMSKVLKKNVDSLYDIDISQRLENEGKKHRPGRISEDVDYVEDNEEEAFSDGEPKKKKRGRFEDVDFLEGHKKEMTVTTRQRALQTGKHGSSSSSLSLIQFPNGLPPPPSRKQKDKLTDLEQQLKKAETAQRRRMQVEKAARESEAEAIRKILGQESSRKKREEKIKKRQEELAKERFENAGTLASDTVRWVMGPSGTVVTFPLEVGLPNLFDPRPCSYPPPREKCAGPSCTNPYKYRHSKSKLPICSLQCYKALNDKMAPVSAC